MHLAPQRPGCSSCTHTCDGAAEAQVRHQRRHFLQPGLRGGGGGEGILSVGGANESIKAITLPWAGQHL